MDLNKINQEIEKLNLDKESKNAFLALMNLKIDSDMEKVLNAIGATNNAISVLKSETNASIGALKSENSSIKWFIGGAIGLATLIGSIVALIIKFVK